MRVARLEVFGFKSFMDRLVLPLEAGITGVVGPNGCGKSNIVDAIRWILGETKASSLRGGTLEDVIFNGTDKLRPLGLAEVTLTLRAQSDNFFADLVSPQREVEEVLKSLEEEIKKQTDEFGGPQAPGVKLQVIEGGLDHAADEQQELGTIINLDGSVVEVSNDDQLAGSEEEPVSTSILTRFSWLKSVSEVQLTRRLYRSGESEFFINRVACRLKDVKDFLRAIGLGARAYTIVAQGEVSKIVNAKPEERRLIVEEAAGVIGFRDKIAASNRKLEETSHNLTRLADVIQEVERQVKTLKKQAERAESRQSLKDEIARLEHLVFQDKAHKYTGKKDAATSDLTVATELEATKVQELQTLSVREDAEKLGLTEIDTEADSIRLQIDARREELLARARQKSQRQSKIDELRAFNMARLTEIKRLEERREVLKTRFDTADTGIQELKTKEITLQSEVDSVQVVSEEDLRQVATQLRQKRDELRIKDGELRTIRDKVIAAQSSIAAMHDQIVAASPLQQLKKALNDGAINERAHHAKVFVEGLVVPASLTKALQSVLAERAAFLVAESPKNIADPFLGALAKQESKSGKGSGIGILAAGDEIVETAQAHIAEATSFGLCPILERIEINPGFKKAAHFLLRNVLLAESSEKAFAFFEAHPSADVTVVTVEGEIHTAVSFYSLRHEGGLIQLQAKVRALETDLVALQEQQKELGALRNGVQDEVTALEQQQSELLRTSEQQQKTLRELTSQLSSVRGRLQAEIRAVDQITGDVERTTHQIKEVEQKIEASRLEEEKLIELAKIELGAASNDEQLEEEITQFSDKLKSVDTVRKEKRAALSEIAQQQSALRSALDTARQQASRAQFAIEKLELEKQAILDRVQTEYGDTLVLNFKAVPEDAVLLSDDDARRYEQEALKIRSRIAREGEVDSSSIERHREEATRLEELISQRKDLDEACTILKKTIARLEEVSKARFVAMFNAVSKNFSRLIPQLFGGGKGGLELTDPSNPLESGIDILMRPPGKKPKRIDLLSGGEKALCATALIFSMFLEKPSPLCVLDEVDAPLDEANLMRFLSLVKEMSKRTQFLLVTHNKRSMSTSDNLIGVTMQEPGSSKVISVSLQEAYEQVA
jgi:chromosome segregation protein